MSTATPKNGPRQLIPPNSPPMSGPSAMPTPRAVDKMMAPAKPPDAEPMITASEVAMNKALPSPHPARNPMIWLMVLDDPARALNTTMSVSPAIRVRLAPMRLETQPVTSMATAVTTR